MIFLEDVRNWLALNVISRINAMNKRGAVRLTPLSKFKQTEAFDLSLMSIHT